MDDLINLFVQSHFTEQQGEDIYECIGLFVVYNHRDPFLELQDLIMNASAEDPIVMCDKFTFIILNAQAYLLDRHGVVLSSESTVAFNNLVLRILFQLQKLQDPLPVLRVLESTNTDVYKFCEIMEMFSDIPITTFLQVVETIRPVCLKLLGEYLYEQEETQQLAAREMPILKANVKLFAQVFGVNPAVKVILDSDTIMGEEFELYLPLYDELRQEITDEKMLIELLLFLLLYSSDGTNNPVEVFTRHSERLVPDLYTANRLSRVIAEMVAQMTRAKEEVA